MRLSEENCYPKKNLRNNNELAGNMHLSIIIFDDDDGQLCTEYSV